jgi:hypothetical protein
MKVYVVGGYIANGGTLMAYHLGRILYQNFGAECVVVTLGGESLEASAFRYPYAFPSVTLQDLPSVIEAKDILIANPSFSQNMFGYRLPGRKLMYVQGFNTFQVIDGGFDHYVAVSHFVKAFLKRQYQMEVPVIHPFHDEEGVPPPRAWASRPADRILAVGKEYAEVFRDEFNRVFRERHPNVELLVDTLSSRLPRNEFLDHLSQHRYMLSLSPLEGFGLQPLEAMAVGTAVVGFHGGGGLDYMRDGRNSLVTSYPRFEQLADRMAKVLTNPKLGKSLTEVALDVPERFSKSRFDLHWIEYFSRRMGLG